MSVPVFSVIVPVYEQWHLVDALLARLAAQSYPADLLEVILVADGGAVPSRRPRGTRLLHSPGRGSYAARNHGASVARGEWLAFTDADCLPDAGWLGAFAEAAVREPGEVILAGSIEVPLPDGAGAYAVYDAVKGFPQRDYVSRGYGATGNLAIPRALFERLGGFDGTRLSGGDAAFCRRAKAEAGVSVRYVEGAVVEHPARTDWRSLQLKARRLKGGQLAAGPLPRRLAWGVRTVLPPVRSFARFLGQVQFPLRYRLLACAIQLRLWGVELVEAVRLVAGGAPERR
jgi:glycosyltransferase involved in cell wall biosynthesis